MVLRLVKDKTGVIFSEAEVQAFHPLGGRRHGPGEGGDRREQERKPTSYVLRIWNRRPDSNWAILKEGLRTGKKPDGETSFDNNINISINYMLTQHRGKLAKAARETRVNLAKDGKVVKGQVWFKYSHDENGVLRVRHVAGRGGKWTTIQSMADLEQYTRDNFSTSYPTVTGQS